MRPPALYPLLPSGSAALRPLFAPISYHLAIESILSGSSPGMIFTDDHEAPRLALVWTQGRVYLAGDPADGDLRTAVRDCMATELRLDAEKRSLDAFTVAYTSEWSPYIDELLASYLPMSGTRHYYERDLARLPEGTSGDFLLRPVDGSLLTRPDLQGQELLIAEMQSERPSVADFLMKSLGTMAVRDQEIIGWCLTEYNVGDRCELGIATAAPFRRQGVALATAVATLRRAVHEGVRKAGWHCWADNAPSIATARALGFTLRTPYPVSFAFVNELHSLAVHGMMAMQEGHIALSLEWFSRAEQLGDLPSWALVQQARAEGARGRTAVALQLLERATRTGFVDFEQLQDDPYLAGARATATWTILRDAAVQSLNGHL